MKYTPMGKKIKYVYVCIYNIFFKTSLNSEAQYIPREEVNRYITINKFLDLLSGLQTLYTEISTYFFIINCSKMLILY